MYTLRKITKDNSEMNFYLGENYSVIYAEISPEKFNELMLKSQFKSEDCYAVVVDEDGEFHFLFNGQRNYIVNQYGRTFANLKQ